jgi:exosortase family protein XrtF
MKELWQNPFVRFIFIFTILLVTWFSLYKNLYTIFPGDIEHSVSLLLAKHANFFTELFGFQTSVEITRDLVITKINDFGPTHGTWIGEPCNGIKVMGLFSIFILAFPGDWKHKLWYVPMGVVVIHLTNSIRVSALTIIEAQWPEYLDFNHNVTFQVVVYGIIFLMWYIWVQKFSGISIKNMNVSQ